MPILMAGRSAPFTEPVDRPGNSRRSGARDPRVLSLAAIFCLCVLGSAGCGEDNEGAIKEQAAKAKGTIPGSRTAQAQSQEEYYEITPGIGGAGSRSGPRPDQGRGYPGAKK